ncbi:TIGR01741 family protein [Staphylococcus sp. SS251]|nr:TIGR01741 family protein [Staphylococcus singaporensis]MBE5677549.1 TIGR01741 family protein [Staphylococcus singaporensis]
MIFEEKLSQMYNEIANKISSMIPVEWEKVYAMAYVNERSGEVFYNYTEPSSDELFYYTSVLNKYNIPRSEFMDSVYELYKQFDNLRELFIEEGLEPWTSCEFDFTRDGKLNVSFDYIDWINTEFDQLGRENYYMYKKFGVLPETEYEMEEIKEIEQYIKEQDEAEIEGR